MRIELTEHQWELLARVLQHGGVLVGPSGHPGIDSLAQTRLEDIDALEAEGRSTVERTRGVAAPHRLSLTEAGYGALGMVWACARAKFVMPGVSLVTVRRGDGLL